MTMTSKPENEATRRGRVVVLQGVSGAGKSTYARTLTEAARAQGLHAAMVSADDYFVRLGSGTYTFVASKLQEAHAACFREFILHLSSAMDANPGCVDLIVVDNTNTTVHELSPYMLAAQAFGFEAEVHRIGCDPAIAAARNLHGVPTQSVRAMAERMARERLPARWAVREVRS
jgi:predicted kinase